MKASTYAWAARQAEATGDDERATRLWWRAGDPRRAGLIQLRLQNGRRAARLFEAGGAMRSAARAYADIGDYATAARLFERAGDLRAAAETLVLSLRRGAHGLEDADVRAHTARTAAALLVRCDAPERAVRLLRWMRLTLDEARLLIRYERFDEALSALAPSPTELDRMDDARMAPAGRAEFVLARRVEATGAHQEAARRYARARCWDLAAEKFEALGDHRRAAQCFHADARWLSAAHHFEQAGDLAQAARCLRHSGRRLEADALLRRKALAAASPDRWLTVGDLFHAARIWLDSAPPDDPHRRIWAMAALERVPPTHRDRLRAQALLLALEFDAPGREAMARRLRELLLTTAEGREDGGILYWYGRWLEVQGDEMRALRAYRRAAHLDASLADLAERLKRQTRPARGSAWAPSLAPQTHRALFGLFDPLRHSAAHAANESAPPPPAAADPAVRTHATPGGSDLRSERSAPVPSTGHALALPPSNAPQDPMIGVRLRERFRVQRRLGRGAQATVYLALDEVLERYVAVKLLPVPASPSGGGRELLHEARAAASVHHPGCAAIFDMGHADGHIYLAMEYLRGRTLRAQLRRGPLSVDQALDIGLQMADALVALHRAGIVHRDIKPENIIVDDGGRACLTDFGIAKHVDEAPTRGRMVTGTIKYMAPEQAGGGPLDFRADLFSLGGVLFEMLTGALPFSSDVNGLVHRMRRAAPELPDRHPARSIMQPVIDRLLAPRPELRFESATALHRALLTARRRFQSRGLGRPTKKD